MTSSCPKDNSGDVSCNTNRMLSSHFSFSRFFGYILVRQQNFLDLASLKVWSSNKHFVLVCQTYVRTAVQNTSDFQVKSQVVTKTAEEPQTPTGTSDCCWDVHSCVYTLPIVLRYLLCSPGITAHWKLSLFDCWGLMKVACKKHNLCITYGACKGWRHVGIYGSGLLSPGFHIFGGDCADVHGLYCRVMQTEKLCCYVLFQLDPKQRHQVDPTAAVGSHTHPNIQWKLLTLNDTNVQTCTSFVLVFLQVLNSVQQLTFK